MRLALAIPLMVTITGFAVAAVIRVPQDRLTIQAALNSLADGDTVLVDSGVYAEALNAPPLSFTLLGNVVVDTNLFRGPWLDPTPLPGSDTLPCLILPPGSRATIERMGFRNGAAMYPPAGRDRPIGGIKVSTSEPLLVRHCVFDSVWRALHYRDATMDSHISDCRFANCTMSSIGGGGGSAIVEDCRFSMTARSECGQVSGGSGSAIRRCLFAGQVGIDAVSIFGTEAEIRDCIFRDFRFDIDLSPNYAIQLSSDEPMSGLVENNLFVDCEFTSVGIIVGLNYVGDSISIRHNRFERCVGPGLSAIAGISLILRDWPPGTAEVYIEENVFVDCISNHAVKSIFLGFPAEVRRNRFYHNFPDTIGVIASALDGSVLRENVFLDNVVGVDQRLIFDPPGGITVDARHNYWGDLSGPYEEFRNPNGRGDAVYGWYVDFAPWYPDTSFLGFDEPRAALPTAIRLTSFPNPFNATTTLRLDVPEALIVRVELFDLLGRKVRELWNGPVASSKTFSIDVRELSSGIYFARAWQTVHHRNLATTKLVLLK